MCTHYCLLLVAFVLRGISFTEHVEAHSIFHPFFTFFQVLSSEGKPLVGVGLRLHLLGRNCNLAGVTYGLFLSLNVIMYDHFVHVVDLYVQL